ncbi:MAG TPA: phospholipid carrier-dependent glycosyltransferase [Candidatus Brocadiia bacterium]|nr:phospholipid carrier-dependent glycosyltransferase [Candidatus Brocadiia bacterium]
MKKTHLALIGLFLLAYIVPLGSRPLFAPDETRYAEVPREMIVSGDWIVPRLNGLRYFEKPPLGYWLVAATMEVFGQNSFSTRLPSALATGFSALMLFFFMRRFGGSAHVAIATSAIYLTFALVFGLGIYAVLDADVNLFLTGTLVAFYFAWREKVRARRWGFLALSGICCGLAFLTKGFLALVVPVIVCAPFCLWEKRWKDGLKMCWLPAVVALLVAIPWSIVIHQREPDFWRFFFWNEHVRRFTAGNAQHREPFFFYAAILPALILPWTFLIPAAIPGIIRLKLSADPILRFAACWFLCPLLFYSVCRGKLATYILPCLPPLAILFASWLHDSLSDGESKAFRIGVLSLIGALIAGAVAFIVFESVSFRGFRLYSRFHQDALAVAGIACYAGVLALSLRQADATRKILLFGASTAPVLLLGQFLMPDIAIDERAPIVLMQRNVDRVTPDAMLISDGAEVRDVCWFFRRTDVYVVESIGELGYGFSYPGTQERLLLLDRFREIIIKNHGSGRIFLFARSRRFKTWTEGLPAPIFIEDNGSHVFAQY